MSRKLQRDRARWELIAAAVLFLLIVLAWLVSFLTAPEGPFAIAGKPFLPISGDHLLGTDNIGRDTFARITRAAVTSFGISLAATAIAGAIGITVGVVAAYAQGYVATVLMRLVDVGLAIPGILIALSIRVILGPGTGTLILSLGVLFAPGIARIAYGAAHEVRRRAYVQAAELDNTGVLAVIFRHILPNAMTPITIQLATAAAAAVALEAALSYLGQGLQPPQPSIGQMVQEYGQFVQAQPLLFFAPVGVLIMLSIAWNLLADGLRRLGTDRATAE